MTRGHAPLLGVAEASVALIRERRNLLEAVRAAKACFPGMPAAVAAAIWRGQGVCTFDRLGNQLTWRPQ